MTNREFYNAVIEANISAEIVAHATKEIEKLDARNEKRSSTPSKVQVENEGYKVQICDFLAEQSDLVNSNTIASAVGISANKVSALCKQLAEVDKIEVVKGGLKSDSGKGKVNGYRIKVAVEVEGE